jgi:hypothetical protein
VTQALKVGRPDVQVAEIRRLSNVWSLYLLHDRYSPDLLAVATHIATDRSAKRRRRRGHALLGLLVRAWDRIYAEHEHAEAVHKYNGFFWDPQPIVATWLAELMSTAWLPSASGRSRAPKDLALPTELSRIGYGSDKSLFLAKVDERLLRSPVLNALRLKRGPTASELVGRLRDLKKKGEPTPEIEQEAETIYHLLALHCTGDTRSRVAVWMTWGSASSGTSSSGTAAMGGCCWSEAGGAQAPKYSMASTCFRGTVRSLHAGRTCNPCGRPCS